MFPPYILNQIVPLFGAVLDTVKTVPDSDGIAHVPSPRRNAPCFPAPGAGTIPLVPAAFADAPVITPLSSFPISVIAPDAVSATSAMHSATRTTVLSSCSSVITFAMFYLHFNRARRGWPPSLPLMEIRQMPDYSPDEGAGSSSSSMVATSASAAISTMVLDVPSISMVPAPSVVTVVLLA